MSAACVWRSVRSLKRCASCYLSGRRSPVAGDATGEACCAAVLLPLSEHLDIAFAGNVRALIGAGKGCGGLIAPVSVDDDFLMAIARHVHRQRRVQCGDADLPAGGV